MSADEQLEVVLVRRQQLIYAISALNTSALDGLITHEWAARGINQILRDEVHGEATLAPPAWASAQREHVAMYERRAVEAEREAAEVKRMNQLLKSWGWTLTVSVCVLAVSILASGCCDEQQRAVYQCADEHARCRAVIDALCETDDAYCPEDERTSPFSRRTPAMGECDQAYEACYLTATTTRTPDRFSRMDGGAL